MPSDFFDLFSVLFDLLFAGHFSTKTEKLHEIPLDEMIDKSKLVVVGKVVRIAEEPTTKDPKDSLFLKTVATIEVEQIILGSYEDKQIDVTYYPRLSSEARFVMSERCILFIGERNLIVKGYAGKIPIEKDKVEVLYILGEQKRQLLKDFIQRIKDSKSRQRTTRNPCEAGRAK
jgi:hypothetical protein